MLRRTAATLFVAALFLAPARGQTPDTKPADKKPASLRVLMPAAGATLTFDGAETRQTGLTRFFESPPIDPTKDYTYTVVAKWMTNNYTTVIRTRVVAVKAGQATEVDLRKEDDQQKDEFVVRYVPTPQVVVDAMLKLAEVGEKDVVYDLGCGDGRIVVTAVAKFKAKRGVGVDIDPERVKDSKATARREKVEDKVEFRQDDVLKMKDLSDASVVMLYMGNDLNQRLKPILQETLRPGSRVVSHRFTMGDWKPLKTIKVKDAEGAEYVLHLWKIGEEKKK